MSDLTYECDDCGRSDWCSLAAMMQCPCKRRDEQ